MGENIKDKIKKVYDLSIRGVGGEKDQADKILNKLMDKYGLSIEELVDDKPQPKMFHVPNKNCETLLNQIYGYVTNKNKVNYYRSELKRTYFYYDVTVAQGIEIEELYNWHRKQLKKELKKHEEMMVDAYVLKHGLTPASSSDNDSSIKNKMSHSEIRQILSMMNTLEDVSYYKALGE